MIQMRLIQAVVLLFITTYSKAQTGTGIPYPQPFPDSVAIRFLPGTVSSDSMDFNAAFSPDGKSFYFTRSINRKTKIYVTHYDGVNWPAPVLVPFLDSKNSEADPVFSPDGTLYFISDRPTEAPDTLMDFNIWFVKPLPGGSWSAPEDLKAVNTDSSEYYISFAENGNLYFASSRKGGFGEEDIYVSKLVGEKYTKPENLGAAVNTSKSEYDPGISADEDVIVFASSNREDGFGAADLYCAKRNGDKKWLKAGNLGDRINTKTREFCPYFSPDGKYFFFSSERDVKWIGMEVLKRQIGRLW